MLMEGMSDCTNLCLQFVNFEFEGLYLFLVSSYCADAMVLPTSSHIGFLYLSFSYFGRYHTISLRAPPILQCEFYKVMQYILLGYWKYNLPKLLEF